MKGSEEQTMLEFEAFEHVPIAHGIVSGVSAMAWWSGMVYIGTNDGRLLLLSLKRAHHDAQGCCDDTQGCCCGGTSIQGSEVEAEVTLGIRGQGVEELVVLAGLGVLIARACGRLYVHDLACLLPRPHVATALSNLHHVSAITLQNAGAALWGHDGLGGEGLRVCVATGACLPSSTASDTRAPTETKLLFFRLHDDYILESSCVLRGEGGDVKMGGDGGFVGVGLGSGGNGRVVTSMAWCADLVYIHFASMLHAGAGEEFGCFQCSSTALHVPTGREHVLGAEWSMPEEDDVGGREEVELEEVERVAEAMQTSVPLLPMPLLPMPLLPMQTSVPPQGTPRGLLFTNHSAAWGVGIGSSNVKEQEGGGGAGAEVWNAAGAEVWCHVRWRRRPTSVSICYPYLLALVREETG